MTLTLEDWYNVGLQLELEAKDLDEIEDCNKKSSIQQRKMFNRWLKSASDHTFQTLAKALQRANEEKATTELYIIQHGKHAS